MRKLESKIERLETRGTDAGTKTKELTEKIDLGESALTLWSGLLACQSSEKKKGADGKEEFVCTVKNSVQKRAVRFALSMLLDEEDLIRQRKKRKDTGESEVDEEISAITYTPRANVEMLPDYLQSVLSFEPDMAPVLLSDVLGALYEDEEEEEGEKRRVCKNKSYDCDMCPFCVQCAYN